MEIVKKNLLSILCGVIALAGIAVYVTWDSSQRSHLRQDLEKRKKTYDDLVAVQNKPRHLPIVSLTPDEQPKELTHFPNQKIIESGKAGVKGLADQSLAVKSRAIALNKHKLLVDGSLPVPVDAFAFRNAYNAQFDRNNANSIPVKLSAATPPTESEIQSRQAKVEKELTDAAPRNAAGEILGKDQLDQQIKAAQDSLPEKMKLEAATQHKMYMAPDALAMHPNLAAEAGMTPDATQIWYAQMMLWVEQDVAAGIGELNKASTKVDQSLVKQLVTLFIAPSADMYTMPNAAAGAAAPPPSDPRGGVSGAGAAGPVSSVPANSDTEPLPKDFSISPTGRACNGVFDVVHFTLVLKVNSADIPRVISGLERGRLITVYQTDIQSVNSAQEAQEGYLLGGNPVAQVTLQCEELFIRDWTKPLMPPDIQTLLNAQPQQPAAAQPTASIN